MSVGKVNKFGRALEHRLGYTDPEDFKAFSELNVKASDVNDLMNKKADIDYLVEVKDDIGTLVGVKTDVLDLTGSKDNILISRAISESAVTGVASTHALKITLDGTDYYIPLNTSSTFSGS